MKPQSRIPNTFGIAGTLNNTLCSPKTYPLSNITKQIISCAIEVHSQLGPGY